MGNNLVAKELILILLIILLVLLLNLLIILLVLVLVIDRSDAVVVAGFDCSNPET